MQECLSKGRAPSWIMFTPTELLKLYVKEAFNRESIPASAHKYLGASHDGAGIALTTRSSPLVHERYCVNT